MAMVKAELGEISEVWRNSPISTIPPKEVMLVTDFDGTLAEIVPDPTLSVALPEAITALQRLARLLRQVVILSSRTSTELASLVSINGVRLVGDSGITVTAAKEKRALEQFNAEAAKLLGDIPGLWIEIKPFSTTVHLRNAQTSGEEVLARLRPLLKATGLYGAPGRKVIEVHSPFVGKGKALAALLDEVNPGGVACFGDDENDRPVFELVSGLTVPHLSIGVNSPEVPPNLFDRCDVVVDGPRAAATFLTLIAEWAEARSGA
jgi:trehalose 6-phosphate phosphatase